MEKYLEKFLPLAISLITIIIVIFLNINSIINLKDIVLSIINFVAILIGFITTMLSILMTSSDKEIMIYIKKKDRIKDLYMYLTIPIFIGFMLIISCLFLITVCDVQKLSIRTEFWIALFLFSYFISACFRAVLVIVSLLFKFSDEPKKEEIKLDLTNAFKDN